MEGCGNVNQDHIENHVEKLHKQFGHPSSKRLSQLIKDGGIKFKDYVDFVDKISDECDICRKFKSTPWTSKNGRKEKFIFYILLM